MQAATKERKPTEQRPAENPAPVRPELRDEESIVDVAAEVEYLLANGWTKDELKDCSNPLERWRDPHSGHADRTVLVVPETRDASGRVKTPARYQKYCGSALWHYSRQKAVTEQRDRDREAAKKKATR